MVSRRRCQWKDSKEFEKRGEMEGECSGEEKRTYEGERKVEMLGALEIPLAGNFGSGEDASA
jgi:hypothetical protein